MFLFLLCLLFFLSTYLLKWNKTQWGKETCVKKLGTEYICLLIGNLRKETLWGKKLGSWASTCLLERKETLWGKELEERNLAAAWVTYLPIGKKVKPTRKETWQLSIYLPIGKKGNCKTWGKSNLTARASIYQPAHAYIGNRNETPWEGNLRNET